MSFYPLNDQTLFLKLQVYLRGVMFKTLFTNSTAILGSPIGIIYWLRWWLFIRGFLHWRIFVLYIVGDLAGSSSGIHQSDATGIPPGAIKKLSTYSQMFLGNQKIYLYPTENRTNPSNKLMGWIKLNTFSAVETEEQGNNDTDCNWESLNCIQLEKKFSPGARWINSNLDRSFVLFCFF